MSDVELLPCPFCGEPAKIESFESSTTVWCGNKECRVQVDLEVADFERADHRAAAIAAWNTRPPLAITDAMVERAVEAAGWKAEPYQPTYEGGAIVESGMSDEDAADINGEMRIEMRRILEAALHPTPADSKSAVERDNGEAAGWFWRWASSDEWRMLSDCVSEAGRQDFIRDQERIAPIVVARLYTHPERDNA